MPASPDPWLLRFAPAIPAGGPVLDLACGSGRHGRWLLEAGFPVTFVDRDVRGVTDLDWRAEVVEADVEAAGWPLGERRFAAVVVFNYLWRPLLPAIAAAVAPGGLLVYATFGRGQERIGRPRNPDFLLRPGELLQTVAFGFRVLAYEHLGPAEGGGDVRQRLCARRLPVPESGD